MSKRLQSKLALATMTAVVATTAVAPVQAAPVATNATTRASNVSTWAESEVKDFLGGSFSSNYNYKFKVTRAEFAELLEKALVDLGYAFNEPSSNPFVDTNNKSAIKMYNAGLLAGTGQKTFSPNDSLTREQMAVIVTRIYENLKVPMPKKYVYKVPDENKISSWAKTSVKMCYEAGIIMGDSNAYSPKAVVPREQAIVILSRTQGAIEEHKKNVEAGNKPGTTPGTGTSTEDVVTNNLYTYNKKTGEIVIKKDCILDVAQSGTPKEFSKVTVQKGVKAELRGIKVSNLVIDEDAKFVAKSCDIGGVITKDGAEFTADKSCSVKEIKTYESADIDTDKAKVEKITVYEAKAKAKVDIEGVIKTIDIEAPATVTIDGEVDKLNINAEDAVVTVSADVDDIVVSEDDIELNLKSGAKVDSVKLEGECEFNVASDVRLKKLAVEDDAMNSIITLKSKYDIDISLKSDCKINGYKVKEKDDVEYEDGKLYINDSDKGSSSDADEDLEDVEDALDKLTYEKLLGKNQDKDKVIYDLELPTKIDDCSVSWMSNNEAVISNTGKVTRIDKDSEVELRAKVRKGDSSENKTFTFYVLKKEMSLDEKIKADLDKITIPATIDSGYDLPKATENGYTLSYATNSPNAVISGNALTVKRTEADQTVTLTMTATSGSTFQKQDRQFVIPKSGTVTPPEEDINKVIQDASVKMLASIPNTISSETTVQTTIDGVSFGISSEHPALTTKNNSGSSLLTPHPMESDASVNLTVAGTYKGVMKDFTKIVTVPKTTTPGENVGAKLDKALNGVVISSRVETNFMLNKTDGDVELRYFSDNDAITFDNSGSKLRAVVTRKDADEVANIQVTASYGGETKSKTVPVTVTKKPTTVDPGEQTVRDALAQLELANPLLDMVNLPQKIGEVCIDYTSNSDVVDLSTHGSGYVVVTPRPQATDTPVEITATGYIPGKGDSVTYDRILTTVVPAKGTFTEADIKEDMQAILGSFILGSEAPFTVKSNLSETLDYSVSITPKDNYITVESDGSKFVIKHNNVNLTEPVESNATVKLTTFVGGEPVEESRDIKTTVVPKYTEEEWQAKLDAALTQKVDEVMERFPTELSGTSQPISVVFDMDIEGITFHGAVIPQLGPNVDAPVPADSKLDIIYDATNHITLNPKVLDGSAVQFDVKVAYQLGGKIRSVKKPVVIELVDTPTETTAFSTLVLKADIFEIINSVDINFENSVATPTFKIVVKDKHLGTVLAQQESVILSQADGKHTGKVELTLSKNAILGEYTYEIFVGDQMVKNGALVNGGTSLSFTKTK